MKLAFSTLGCPDFSWPDIYSMAKDFGFAGIELRGTGSDIFSVGSKPFSAENIGSTAAQLKGLRLEISCVSSGSALKHKDRIEETVASIEEYIHVASRLNARFVRVLADEKAFPDGDVDDDFVCGALRRLAPVAEAAGVTLLVETNGVYSDTARLRDLLIGVASDAVAALWDINHPCRFAGERPDTTIENLGAFVKYVHFKDSIVQDGKVVYKMMGEGDLPIDEIMMALRSVNYDGFISLEWLKTYTPDLEDAGIVFPHFANFMAEYIGTGDMTGRLQDNNRGTGKYVWPKERLIDLTFPQVLDRMCDEFPEQIAFRYTELDYTRSYAQFRDEVDTFARALIAMGVKPGDKVAIWATNVPQWFITFWASVKIGAVLVTVNTAYKIHEAEYLLRQSDTHTLVMIDGCKDSDYAAIIRELCPELETAQSGQPLHCKKLPFLRNIISCESVIKGCYSWDQAMAKAQDAGIEEVARRAAALGKDDVCNMQYTSGTTGFPKGVMLTHYNIINNGKAIGDCMDFSTADRLMIQVPMFHCFGMVLAMTAAMTHGASMFPITMFSPKKGLHCINQERITAVHGVPTMFIAMLGHPDFGSTDFSHVRTGIMAGSPCPIKVMQDVIEKMNASEICITYGQTESSPAITMSKTTDSVDARVNTVGQEIFGVSAKIVDPATGDDLPDGTDGELVARGYNIMKGYYKMPGATAAAIDRNGWLHTGDLARRDANGYFKITGRIKDMVIRGGENIYPKEIEDFFYTHPKVSDVQVIGVPDKQYGEEIMACMILKAGETATEEEMKEFAQARIAKHKVPRYIRFVEGFPANAAGKIMKYKMREAAVEMLGLQDASKIETA